MKFENENTQDRAEDFVAGSADQANEAVLASQDALITLPPGASLENLTVEGRDLVVTLADGSRIVIPDGAVFVPSLAINGVTVQSDTIIQLLTGNEPEPAGGPPRSSGGNFATDEGAIQAAFDIGDLLPFTELSFAPDEEPEIIPAIPDEEPEVIIETPDNPAGVKNAIATVDEDGLPVRGGEDSEPEGTRSETDSEKTSGTIVFDAPDGLSAILMNGVPITTVGQSFSSPVGTLTITSINLATGEIGFTYVLEDNTLGEDVDGFFEVTVIDRDGDEATASLSIIIVDDSPIAADDIGIVPAGSHAPISGNVLVNDEPGADDYALTGAVQGFSKGSTTAAPGGTIQGQYGTLTLNADGTYTYTRAVNTPGGVEESFQYTIVDGDGSTSTATLTIRIGDAPDTVTNVPRVGDGTVVNEGALAPRGDEPVGSSEGSDGNPNNDSDPTENTGAAITFNSPDGVASVTLNGVAITPGSLPQTIFTDATGSFVVTGYAYDPVTGNGTITYEYTLADNTSGDNTSVEVDIVVTDLDGDKAEDTLVISIVDDKPEAQDDSEGQVAENAPVTIDVLSNDITGADDVAPSTVALVPNSLSGTGTLVNNGDGTFTYTPGPGEEGTVTFDYTITDGDGDVSTATATLELRPDSEPEGGETTATVDDDGLAGNNPASTIGDLNANADDDPADTSEATFTGVLPFNVFNDGPATISFDPALAGATAAVGAETVTYSISGNTLTATVTGGARDGTALFTVEITDAATGAYKVTLLDNVLHSTGNDENNAFASIDFVVADSDGDTSLTNLGIVFDDDAPTASDDANSIASGQYGPVGGNVLGNDAQGADGATVTSYSGAQDSGAAGTEVQGVYGKLTIAADGTYSYTRDPGTPGGVTDTFSYTITDADGDTATAALVITIGDGKTDLDLPVAGEDGTIVDEAGLAGPPAGSDAASDSETTLGTFTFSAQDGPATVFIDGNQVTSVGQTFTGTYGTLEITAINAGSISYSYTLETNTSGDNTSDSFVVRVEDQDDDFSEDTLEIAIIDDVPTAAADSDSVTEDGPLVADGNVLTGSGGTDTNASDGVADVDGADQATVTGLAFGDIGSDVSGNVGGAGVAGDYGTLIVNANGSYSYTLDNANEFVQGLDENETLTETFTYTITDGDGDTSTTTVTITINGADDPVVIDGLDLQAPELVFDEDDLADGSSPDAGALTKTGSFDITSVDGLSTLTVGGVTVFDANAPTVYPVTIDDPVYGILTITGVATTLDANGDVVAATVSYSYTLQDNSLLHTGGNDGSFTDSFEVIATDTDGSQDTASLDIEIIDDTPAATDNAKTVDEGDSVSGNVLTDDDTFGVDVPGADGYGATAAVIEITSVNDSIVQTTLDGSGNLVITTSLGVLTVDPVTGAYTYDSTANSTNVNVADVFTYTIVDGDGDTSTATLTLNVTNAPGVVSDNDVQVNEAGLADGSSPLDGTQIDSNGQISVVGATGTLVYSLDGSSPGPGANEVQIDGTYGTIVLNTVTGAYTYTLDTPYTDAVDENGTNTVSPAESFTYQVRDTNNNLIGGGSIVVSIIDDIPTATDQANVNVAEDLVGTIGGNVMTDGTPDTEGADGATVTAITVDGNETLVPQDGSDAVVITAKGTYTIDMDGNWTFDPNPNQNQSSGNISAGFTYTLSDTDGDFDTAVQPITITDGKDPSAGPDISLALDDQNLADGSTPAGPDFDSDTIVFTEGSDDIVSIIFGDTSGLGAGLTWVRVSDTQITGSDGARLVVTLDLSVNLTTNTATVTATLNDNYDDHPTINVDDLVDLGDVNVIAEDIDGDTATAVVSVSVSDDLPSISASAPAADALTVDETDLGTDATADFSGLFTSDANADGPGTVGGYTLGINPGVTGLVDTATNEAVVLSMNGSVVEGRTAGTDELVFTVSVDSAGIVTLDQLRAVKHGNTSDDNDPETLDAANLITLSATITDSDGDKATATANIAGAITFLDDGPALSNVLLASSVSVDETDGLTTSATSADSILSYVADYGEDGDNGETFTLTITDVNSGLATAVGDYPITLVQTSTTLITGVFDNGSGDQPAFTVEINPDGTITLTQIVALEHLIDGDNTAGEHNDTLNLAGKISATVTIKDGDGDTDFATVPVGNALTFYDDGPSVALSGVNDSLSVSDADYGTDASTNFADNFTFDGGEDGSAGTDFELFAVDQSDSGLIDTATGNSVFLFLEGGVVIGREGVDAASAASGEEVFRVTVDGSGNVTLNQSRAVDHALSTGSTGTSVSLASDGLIQLIGKITDNDGDTASKALDIGSNLTFTDDTPTAEPTLTAYLDDDTLGGNAGGPDDQTPDTLNLTGTLVDPTEGFGNDGGSVAFNLASTLPSGFRLVDDPASDGVLIQQEQGTGNWVTVVTVSLNGATGAYTVSQNANILHPDDGANDENEVTFTLGATLTDGDNDTATTSLTIVVDDDTPTSGTGSRILTVDEDGLTNGIANNGTNDATGSVTVVNTTVTADFSAGADTPLTYAFDPTLANLLPALTSGGVTVTYVVTANSIVATAGATPIFTVSLNATTGQFIFTLQGPVDHADADDSENVTDIDINFGPLMTATDADGDTVHNGKGFIIRIDDDSPRANPDTDSLTEDSTNTTGNVVLGTGTDSGAAGADESGADGFASPVVKAISGFNGAGTVGGSTVGEWGTLVLNGDGSYTYTPNNAALQGLDTNESETDTFTYTIEDKDGDAVSTTLIITINGVNDAPVANPDTNWTIEDAGAPITGNVLQNVSHPGAPSGTFADMADTDVDIEPLSVTTTGTFNGTYGILTLNSNGTYSYSLYTQAQNPTAYAAVQALDEGDAPLTDSFNYTASDGTASNGSTLTISIFGTNDAPVVGTATVATSDEGLAGGLPDGTGNPTDTTNLATASGNIVITDVDDSTFTVTLGTPSQSLAVADGSVSGAPITWSLSVDGKTLTGTINGGTQTAITLVINDTGAFTVTQSLPIFHSNTSSEDVTSFTVNVSVNDGTTTTVKANAITVNLEDDSPIAVVAADLTTSNAAGSSGTAFLDSDFDVDNNFGGDGGKVIFTQASIDALVAQGLTSDFVPLSYSISPDGTVLTAVKQGSGDTVFTITLDPLSAPDQYVLNLVQELDATSTIDFNGGDYNFVGGNLSWTGFVPLVETLGGTPVDNQSQDLLLTPEVGGVNAGSVNTTATIGGISGGASVGSAETFRVDFVLDLRGDPADTVGGQDYAALANRDHVFDGHYTVNGATALFKSSNGSKVKITAFDDADGNNVVGDGTIDPITGITIAYRGVAFGSVITPTSTPTNYTVNGHVFTVTLNPDGSVSVDGVAGDSGSSLLGTVIGVFTATGFNSVEYTYQSGGTFQVGDFGATAITNDPVSFNVPISVVDNDGDTVSSGDLDITLNPASPSSTTFASAQAFSSMQVPLDEPLIVSNDNGSGSGGSGGDSGLDTFSGTGSMLSLQESFRSDLRMSEMTLVAALSGAMMFDQTMTEASAFSGMQTSFMSYQLMPIDSVLLEPNLPVFEGADTAAMFGLFGSGIDAFDPVIEWNGLNADSALATSAELSLGLQSEPMQFEPYISGEAAGGMFDASAFFGMAGGNVDQAMEALLAIQPEMEAIADIAGNALPVDGLAEHANSVIADIAAEAALDTMIEGLTDAIGVSEYLVAEAGVPNMGLLDQMFDSPMAGNHPMAIMNSEADEAAAVVAAA